MRQKSLTPTGILFFSLLLFLSTRIVSEEMSRLGPTSSDTRFTTLSCRKSSVNIRLRIRLSWTLSKLFVKRSPLKHLSSACSSRLKVPRRLCSRLFKKKTMVTEEVTMRTKSRCQRQVTSLCDWLSRLPRCNFFFHRSFNHWLPSETESNQVSTAD